MRSRISYTILAFAVLLMSGCTTTEQHVIQEYYKPVTDIQQSFYDIQALFNGAKYEAVIDASKVFLDKYSRDVLNVGVVYYMACSYQKLAEFDLSDDYYNQIIKKYPDTDWARLSAVGLEENKELKKTAP